MLEFLQVLGFLLLCLVGPAISAVLVVGYGLYNPTTGLGIWIYKWWPFGVPLSVQTRQKDKTAAVEKEIEKITQHVSKASQLKTAKPRDMLTIMGNRHTVAGTHVLLK